MGLNRRRISGQGARIGEVTDMLLISPVANDVGERVWTWERLVAAWLLSQRSEHTRRAYQIDVFEWTRWCLRCDTAPMQALRVHVDAWARSMDTRANSTVFRKLAAVSSLYKYAVQEGVLDRNPVAGVRRPPVSKMSDTRWLTVAEVRLFIREAAKAGERDHAIALLLALSGLRNSEIRELRIEQIGYTGQHHTLLIHGKGDHDERVPIPEPTAEALDLVIGDRTFGWVFPHDTHRTTNITYGPAYDGAPLPVPNVEASLSAGQMRRIITRLANRSGINSKNHPVTPHSFRHAGITAALDAGVDIRMVEVFARHMDGKTTRRYDRTRNNYANHACFTLARVMLSDA